MFNMQIKEKRRSFLFTSTSFVRCTLVGNPGEVLGVLAKFFWGGYLGCRVLLHFYDRMFLTLLQAQAGPLIPLPPPCVHLWFGRKKSKTTTWESICFTRIKTLSSQKNYLNSNKNNYFETCKYFFKETKLPKNVPRKVLFAVFCRQNY